jgi:hypothetical protein
MNDVQKLVLQIENIDFRKKARAETADVIAKVQAMESMLLEQRAELVRLRRESIELREQNIRLHAVRDAVDDLLGRAPITRKEER